MNAAVTSEQYKQISTREVTNKAMNKLEYRCRQLETVCKCRVFFTLVCISYLGLDAISFREPGPGQYVVSINCSKRHDQFCWSRLRLKNLEISDGLSERTERCIVRALS
jgi:hypothetical protein